MKALASKIYFFRKNILYKIELDLSSGSMLDMDQTIMPYVVNMPPRNRLTNTIWSSVARWYRYFHTKNANSGKLWKIFCWYFYGHYVGSACGHLVHFSLFYTLYRKTMATLIWSRFYETVSAEIYE
jgi:hypothetical protein